MDKTILLASFLFPERIEWFLTYLDEKFDIHRTKVFCYQNLDDESRVIVTFRLTLTDNKHLDLKNLFPNAIIIHKKGNALYTINALNKLIEQNLGDTIGNIDYKSYKIDWEKHQNQLILIDNKELKLLNIKRIF